MIKLFIDVEYDEYYVALGDAYMLLEDWQGDGGPVLPLKDFINEDGVSTLHFVSEYTRAQLAAM